MVLFLISNKTENFVAFVTYKKQKLYAVLDYLVGKVLKNKESEREEKNISKERKNMTKAVRRVKSAHRLYL